MGYYSFNFSMHVYLPFLFPTNFFIIKSSPSQNGSEILHVVYEEHVEL